MLVYTHKMEQIIKLLINEKTSLEHFNVIQESAKNTKRIIHLYINNNTSINTVELENTHEIEAYDSQITEIVPNTNLKVIKVLNCDNLKPIVFSDKIESLTVSKAELILNYNNSPSLRSLNYENCLNVMFIKCPNLTSLSIFNCDNVTCVPLTESITKFSAYNCEKFSRFTGVNNIEYLTIVECPQFKRKSPGVVSKLITDKFGLEDECTDSICYTKLYGVTTIKKREKLRVLCLVDCPHITEIEWMKLYSLDIEDCPGIEYIGHFQSLRKLRLAGDIRLKETLRFKNLKELSIENTFNVIKIRPPLKVNIKGDEKDKIILLRN